MLNDKPKMSLVIALIIMAILVVTSFLPLVQILLMTLNGAVIYPLYAIADNDEVASRYIFVIDSIMSVVGLTLFYLSTKNSWRILSAILTVLFLLPLMVLIFEFIGTDFYFLQYMIAGFAVGFILVIVGTFKMYFSPR